MTDRNPTGTSPLVGIQTEKQFKEFFIMEGLKKIINEALSESLDNLNFAKNLAPLAREKIFHALYTAGEVLNQLRSPVKTEVERGSIQECLNSIEIALQLKDEVGIPKHLNELFCRMQTLLTDINGVQEPSLIVEEAKENITYIKHLFNLAMQNYGFDSHQNNLNLI